eukprot:TRINITY_DN6416_c0_g1_i1.p1 TRINITY_DN6416_c0_g1~~TRINITY_DN6416_c0_g1_i1.p1  ORF type:complete len:484 (-),score=127.35 TRINITY_DN6416_c0_g1_i1:951-2402(-)
MQASPPSSSPLRTYGSEHFRRILVLSLAFFFIIFGFFSTQAFQTTKKSAAAVVSNGVHGAAAAADSSSAGATTLAILYGSYMGASLVAAPVVHKIGLRASLIISAVFYVIFIATNLFNFKPLSYIAGALDGVAAAVIWTAQGAYLTKCATSFERENDLQIGSTIGSFNGLFFAVIQVARLLGTLCVAVLSKEDMSQAVVFMVLTCAAFAGAITTLAIKNPEDNAAEISKTVQPEELTTHVVPSPGDAPSTTNAASSSVEASVTETSSGSITVVVRKNAVHRFCSSLGKSLSLIIQPKFGLILPSAIHQGLSVGFIVGVVPSLCKDQSLRFFALSMFALINMISCMVAGRLSDKIGRRPVILAGVSAQFLSFAMVLFGAYEEPLPYVTLTALLGIADSVWNTQPSAILGTFYRDNAVSAFANFKLFQSAGVSLSFACYSLLSTSEKAWMCMGTGTLAVGCLQGLHYLTEGIDRPKNAMKLEEEE